MGVGSVSWVIVCVVSMGEKLVVVDPSSVSVETASDDNKVDSAAESFSTTSPVGALRFSSVASRLVV